MNTDLRIDKEKLWSCGNCKCRYFSNDMDYHCNFTEYYPDHTGKQTQDCGMKNVMAWLTEPITHASREFIPHESEARQFLSPQVSLRDWFAGMAAIGRVQSFSYGLLDDKSAMEYAKFAYKFADAMMKAREVGNK
jgi:hypothetical protein